MKKPQADAKFFKGMMNPQLIHLYCELGLAYPVPARFIAFLRAEMLRRSFINKQGRLTVDALQEVLENDHH